MSEELDDGLTEAERNYFKTGGDVNDALVVENKDLPVVEVPPIVPASPEAPPKTETPAVPAEPEVDDEPADKKPTRISFKKYEEASQRAQDLERQLQDQAVRNARVEERLTLLQQALQPQEKVEEAPDPEKDIFGYVKHLEGRVRAGEEKVSAYEQQINEGQSLANEERRYFSEMNDFAAKEPNLVNAYNFLLRVRAAELMAPRYPGATFEQLLQAEVPPEIGQDLREEEQSLYREAFAGNINPGAQIMRYAQLRGYRAQPAQPAAAAQPVALRQTVNQPTQAGDKQTATQVVEAIQRGQAAATSLSNVSGTPPATELTPEALANMSDEEFTEVFNQYQHQGNKAKLMALMGH